MSYLKTLIDKCGSDLTFNDLDEGDQADIAVEYFNDLSYKSKLNIIYDAFDFNYNFIDSIFFMEKNGTRAQKIVDSVIRRNDNCDRIINFIVDSDRLNDLFNYDLAEEYQFSVRLM